MRMGLISVRRTDTSDNSLALEVGRTQISQWGLPATAFNAATFGEITSVVPNSPRVLQLGLKYVF